MCYTVEVGVLKKKRSHSRRLATFTLKMDGGTHKKILREFQFVIIFVLVFFIAFYVEMGGAIYKGCFVFLYMPFITFC